MGRVLYLIWGPVLHFFAMVKMEIDLNKGLNPTLQGQCMGSVSCSKQILKQQVERTLGVHGRNLCLSELKLVQSAHLVTLPFEVQFILRASMAPGEEGQVSTPLLCLPCH